MIDTPKYKGLRLRLVELLKQKGITDARVLDAIGRVPRHFFLHLSGFENSAYEDCAYPIGNGQTISQPYTVAFQSQLLAVEKRERILEIGTGSGYQAAVLHELGAKVFSIERQRELYLKTKPFLNKLGYRMDLFLGDGYKGLPAFAPFDKILVTAAAPEIPAELLRQLRVGGRLVIPVGGSEGQEMYEIIKETDTDFITKKHGAFAFVPMLKGVNQ